ncbi:hypothetical protein [Microbacterium sp.]|uniref:hypothetical protein n=1 Tax=Microbacterium sp. TaxID=51671 RepID=UPI003F9D190F
MKSSPLRVGITVISTVVLITFVAALFLTDMPTWPLLAGAMVILIPAQIYLHRTRARR